MTKYLIDCQGKSLISRIYGVYKVKYRGMASVYLMLQKNNVKTEPNGQIECIFDLKGSKY
jgi:hypothetical protein